MYIKRLPYCKSDMQFVILDETSQPSNLSTSSISEDPWLEVLQNQEKELDDEITLKTSSLDSSYREFKQAQSEVQKAMELAEQLEKQKRLVERQVQEAMLKQQNALAKTQQAEKGLKEAKKNRERVKKQKEEAIRSKKIKEEVERARKLQEEADKQKRVDAFLNKKASNKPSNEQSNNQSNTSSNEQSNTSSNDPSNNSSNDPLTKKETAAPASTAESSNSSTKSFTKTATLTPIVVIRDCMSQLSRIVNNCFSWYIFMASSRPMLMNAISMVNMQLTQMNPACVNSALNLVGTVLNSLNSYIQRIDDAVKEGRASNLQQASLLVKQCIVLKTSCETIVSRLQNIRPVYVSLVSSAPSASSSASASTALATQKSASTIPEPAVGGALSKPFGGLDLAVDTLGGECSASH